jgi:MATE family multidrug resistance protein
MAVVNTDILIRSILLEAMFVSFMFLGASGGDVELAANQVLFQFLFITAYAMDGFAFAAEALVGQALGARQRSRLRQAAKLSFLWGAGVGSLMSLMFLLLGGAIIDLMATSPEVRIAARLYLPYMIIAPFSGVAAWMLDGIFIGATRSRDMRNMMAISAVVYTIAVVTLVPMFGNHGLWLSLLISFVVRGITLGLRYPSLEAEADSAPA